MEFRKRYKLSKEEFCKNLKIEKFEYIITYWRGSRDAKIVKNSKALEVKLHFIKTKYQLFKDKYIKGYSKVSFDELNYFAVVEVEQKC